MSKDPELFLGVDPGNSGGICLIDQNKKLLVTAVMPLQEVDGKSKINVKSLVPILLPYTTYKICIVVEKVWAYQGQGVSSTFTFGKATGTIIGALEAIYQQDVHEVSPQMWQKRLWGRVDDPKIAAMEYVAKEFPNINLCYSKTTGQLSNRVKVPHGGLVDALAIADFARKHWQDIQDSE
jgi:hypothetical protein